MSARSRLTRREIHGVLRALRRLSRRNRGGNDELVASVGEILAEDKEHEFRRDSATDDTRARTAVMWLEDAQLLSRDENRVRVFASSLRVQSVAEARQKLHRARIADSEARSLIKIVETLIESDPDAGVSTDQLMSVTGLDSPGVRRALWRLEQFGVASDDTAITAFVHHGVPNSSRKRLGEAAAVERDLLDWMQELVPDLDVGEKAPLDLRVASQRLRGEGHKGVRPEHVTRILRGVARDGRDEGDLSPRASAGYRIGEAAFVWVGASRGFRVPSLTELYADGLHFQFPVGTGIDVLNWFRSDPTLAAERGTSWEAGIRGGRGSLSFETTCFDQTVADYVDQVVVVSDPSLDLEMDPVTGRTIIRGTTYNASLDARLRGCEAAGLFERPRFRMRASGSVLDTENLDTGEALGRAPANALHLMASTRIPSLDLEVGGRATLAGSRSRGLAASRSADADGEAPGYRVLDLFLRFTPDGGPLAGVDWTLALNNLTDEYYAVFPAVVPQPGRSLRVSAAYRFGFSR